MQWARTSSSQHNVQFDTISIQSREKVINDLQNQFLLKQIQPQCIDITLRASNRKYK